MFRLHEVVDELIIGCRFSPARTDVDNYQGRLDLWAQFRISSAKTYATMCEIRFLNNAYVSPDIAEWTRELYVLYSLPETILLDSSVLEPCKDYRTATCPVCGTKITEARSRARNAEYKNSTVLDTVCTKCTGRLARNVHADILVQREGEVLAFDGTSLYSVQQVRLNSGVNAYRRKQ